MQIAGHVVIIGEINHELDDHLTIVGRMSGLLVQANYIEALLDDRLFRPMPVLDYALGFLHHGGAGADSHPLPRQSFAVVTDASPARGVLARLPVLFGQISSLVRGSHSPRSHRGCNKDQLLGVQFCE